MPEIRDIPLALIDPPTTVLGFDERYEDVDELAADIRSNGLLYPLIVHASGDRYTLRDGKRRWHACKQLELTTVRCIVHGEGDPPEEAVKLKANLMREANTDAEIAVWLEELATIHGWSLERICSEVQRSESWVNDRIGLLQGDPAVLQALAEKNINFSQARALNRCKSDGLRAEGLKFAVFDNIPARKLEDWIKRNDGAPAGNAGVPEGAPLPAAVVPETDGGIQCKFCGGARDPQNMVSIWIHRWELEVVEKVLAQGGSNG